MAYPAFDAVRPARSTASNSSRAQRLAALAALLVASVVAVSFTFSQSVREEPAAALRAESQLFDEPSISLGIRDHEALDTHRQDNVEKQKPKSAGKEEAKQPKVAESAPTKPVQSLATEDNEDDVDISQPTQNRFNYQLNSKLTWPPHDTADIPTGAYSKTYKGPYDQDYDWPDDTQVGTLPNYSKMQIMNQFLAGGKK